MPKIAVCAKCRRKCCDGGLWKIVHCEDVNKNDCLSIVEKKFLTNCTVNMLGIDKQFYQLPLDSVAYRLVSLHQYGPHYRQTLIKVEM